ncbi:hypothetical protein DiNV_CH01M_ORF106 [Drosophila innubila nudivirus]|uniref:Uncharacterized protein n=1 Tax=Drosophila innubila nudivirus TaxID=2057187 RepID=A0A2H4UXB2_9VIRU|nr:hypothetical protein DiNV_CH01M_ORF106 [Drosophila innubila nudivirus]ATZ81553.1 hypothetical protein DiNV_CH01M_ORF106 [Drosophila innubila nudivirus]
MYVQFIFFNIRRIKKNSMNILYEKISSKFFFSLFTINFYMQSTYSHRGVTCVRVCV